jgi:hypothetical protein
MQSYTKVYLDAFGKDETDFVPCEICQNKATEIHHILARSKYKHLLNDIMNLQAICRSCHQEYGDEVYIMPMLLKIHRKILEINEIEFDKKHFAFYIELYETKTELKNG